MDELEWLKENSPSTRPSRDTTRRHRTQLRSRDRGRGRRRQPRTRRPRPRRGRHRVLVTTAVVVVLCAVGAGVVALTSLGGDESGAGSALPPPSARPRTTSARRAAGPRRGSSRSRPGSAPGCRACTDAEHRPESTRWSAWTPIGDRSSSAGPPTPKPPSPGPERRRGSMACRGSPRVRSSTPKAARTARRLRVPDQPQGCETLQITVSGARVDTVRSVSDGLVQHPFVSPEPLVTTSQAATAAPRVVACEGVGRHRRAELAVRRPRSTAACRYAADRVRSAGGSPRRASSPANPGCSSAATTSCGSPTARVAYVKQVRPGVVTTVARRAPRATAGPSTIGEPADADAQTAPCGDRQPLRSGCSPSGRRARMTASSRTAGRGNVLRQRQSGDRHPLQRVRHAGRRGGRRLPRHDLQR